MKARCHGVFLLALLCCATADAFAGGPLLVGGPAVEGRPAFGIDGKPFTWNPTSMPVRYRLDPGPMAATASGTVVVSHSVGSQRVQSMFGVWQGLSTASLSFSNAGSLLASGSYSGGDLKTIQQYNDVVGSCRSARQNPIIFDADGSLISSLGLPPEIIGFAGICGVDESAGHITGALVVLNGRFQDNVNTPSGSAPNYEMTVAEFDEAISHEIGHFLGLDHSQINVELFLSQEFPCEADKLAGLPLMFPVATCQARRSAGLPVLAPDDASWISALYPSATQVSSYGRISGRILFRDGISQVQGANVIARRVDDPNTIADESRRVAVSVVSGYLFTGNPGQSVTGNNSHGAPNGSRDPQWIGYYELQVPPGTYTVEVESIHPGFRSSIGPLPQAPGLPGGQAEFWNQNESAFDFLLQRDYISVSAGENITGIDIILNGTPPTYDGNEDVGMLFDLPGIAPLQSSEGVPA